jgi:hypothetical protein
LSDCVPECFVASPQPDFLPHNSDLFDQRPPDFFPKPDPGSASRFRTAALQKADTFREESIFSGILTSRVIPAISEISPAAVPGVCALFPDDDKFFDCAQLPS